MMTTEDIANLLAVEDILDHYALDTDTEYTMKPKISVEKAEKMFREHPIRKAYFDMRNLNEEESEIYNAVVKKLSTKTGIKIFDVDKIVDEV